MTKQLTTLALIAALLLPAAALARGASSGGRGSFAPSARQAAPVSRTSVTAPRTSSSFTTPRTISSSYRPSFSGYTPPLGSRVFSPGFSFTELFFWSYLFSHTGHQNVQVQQPDGHTVTAQTNNVDVMYYIDIGLLLFFGFGVIGLIVWLVNKLTQPKPLTQGLPYGAH